MDIRTIKFELENAPHNCKTGIINKYSEMYGLSKSQIYRRIREQYGSRKKISKRKKISDELIDLVAKLKVESSQLSLGNRKLSTEECLTIMKDSNVPGAENLVVGTVDRRLREKGFGTREKVVRVEAARPNQTHQLDFARSKYFQVSRYNNELNTYMLKVSGRHLSYKESEIKLRTWLVGLIDTYSRLSIAMAFAATGESSGIGLQLLRFAYGRDEDRHPLIYLPENLKCDNGAFIKSTPIQNMLRALQIKDGRSKPYKHRGIQKVESLWRTIWQKFELPLAMQLGKGTEISLLDYNEMLHDKMIELAEEEHPTRAGTKVHLYKSNLLKTKPRRVEVDLMDVVLRVQRRKVNQSCQVYLNNEIYEVPEFALDKWIIIYSNGSGGLIGETENEYNKPFSLKPTKGFVEEGDFTGRRKATYQERIESMIETMQKNKGDKDSNSGKIKYMPVKSTVQNPDTPFHREETEELNQYEARLLFGKLLGRIGIDASVHQKTFDNIYAELGDELLTKTMIKEMVKFISNRAVNE